MSTIRSSRRSKAMMLFFAFQAASFYGHANADKILVETDSQYHHVVVSEDEKGYRHLSFERARGNQSAVHLGHPEELVFPYARTTMAALSFLPKIPTDMLCVGLGGGSLPMFFRTFFPGMNIDLAEIDPEVVRVSQEFLGFKSDAAMKVSTSDGRVYLRRTDRKYDLIILDAYDSSTIPFHLTTREFLEIVKSHLKPGGIVAANIWSPSSNQFYYAEVMTYQAVFDQLYILQAKGSGNYIFVAIADKDPRTPEGLVARALTIMDECKFPFDLVPLVRDQLVPVEIEKEKAYVLTDDHAPVDSLRNQKVSR